MAAVCEVSNCPAFAEGKRKTCGPHRDARTAKVLGISKDADGRGGKRCIACRRTFADGDYVHQKPQHCESVRKNAGQTGYRHIACDPPSPRLSKKAIRESEKTLFADRTEASA